MVIFTPLCTGVNDYTTHKAVGNQAHQYRGASDLETIQVTCLKGVKMMDLIRYLDKHPVSARANPWLWYILAPKMQRSKRERSWKLNLED